MEYVDVMKIKPVKPNLIVMGDVGYWADDYLPLPQGGYLFVNIVEKLDEFNRSPVIISKVDLDGTVTHEFRTSLTMGEFLVAKQYVLKKAIAMETEQHKAAQQSVIKTLENLEGGGYA